jgi:CheY-specific phosphatase CheX
MKNRFIIDDIVCSSARELFEEHDTHLEAIHEILEPHDYVAVIGFNGGSMRGAIGVGLDHALALRLLGSPDVDRRLVEDCTGEAANQLLGRVKNKLLTYGVVLGIALPILLRGVELRIEKREADVWAYRFAASGGGLTVWFDGHIEADFVLEQSHDEERLACSEGEITLF